MAAGLVQASGGVMRQRTQRGKAGQAKAGQAGGGGSRRGPQHGPPHVNAVHLGAGSVDAGSVLDLQRLAGNAAVGSLLQTLDPDVGVQRDDAATAVEGGPEADAPAPQSVPPISSWTRDQVKAVQRELKRLRLYTMSIDGKPGPGTRTGLVEAFGGDEWQTLGPAAMQARLAAAQRPPAGGGRQPRYGELFKDGVLDMTLGLGFLEEVNPQTGRPFLEESIEGFRAAFGNRGFLNDAGLAGQIMAASGRGLGPSAFGEFFVKPDALTYRPPAAAERSVHVVVRLVAGGQGQGAEAAQTFQEGMAGGDVSYYTGHGRYGTGPDFDRNFISFTLRDARGQVEQVVDDYEVLAGILRRESGGTGAWNRFRWRERRGRIEVEVSNAGNLRLVARNLHPNEFGSRLLHWAMARSGTTPVTGAGGSLGQAAAANPQRQYRILVFDGCRTQDYERSIRSTPGFDTRSTDMIQTRRTVGFHAEIAAFMAFLDSVIGQQSASQVIGEMNQAMVTNEGGHPGSNAFVGSGFGDNPLQ